MRRTGKLYTLTLISASLAILASVLASCWNDNTSAFHLWVDLIPQGLGVASFITTTLIVCFFLLLSSPYILTSIRRWLPVFTRRTCLSLSEVRVFSRVLTRNSVNNLQIFLVTYLFRTTGQVLGVSLSGAVLQAVLLQKLRERIHGPDAVEVSDLFFIHRL